MNMIEKCWYSIIPGHPSVNGIQRLRRVNVIPIGQGSKYSKVKRGYWYLRMIVTSVIPICILSLFNSPLYYYRLGYYCNVTFDQNILQMLKTSLIPKDYFLLTGISILCIMSLLSSLHSILILCHFIIRIFLQLDRAV